MPNFLRIISAYPLHRELLRGAAVRVIGGTGEAESFA
jgi:hypothetical protein